MKSREHILENFNKYIKDKRIIFLFTGAVVLNFIVWFLLYRNITPQEGPIFLHYNIYFGVDLIGEWYRLYLLPGVGIIILLINVYLGYLCYKRHAILAVLVLSLTVFIQAILLISAYLLIRVNA